MRKVGLRRLRPLSPRRRTSRLRCCVFSRPALNACLLLSLILTGCAPRRLTTREPVLIFGEPGRREGQFNFPRSVDFMRDGTVLVMDRSDRVQRFTADGQYLGVWHTGP